MKVHAAGLCCALAALAWPAVATAQTKYYALLIANDEEVQDNDDFETALLNWNSWVGANASIVKMDNRSGAQILADIAAWVPNIDGDDVALFYYSGHGGIRADAAGGGADEQVNDPQKDNDPKRKVDEVLGRLGADRRIVAPAFDDQIKTSLGVLPASTTLVTIFDMCFAYGEWGGTADRNNLLNIGVIGCVPEAVEAGFVWTNTALIPGFFDGPDANALADADINGNGQLSFDEIHVYADGVDNQTLAFTNIAGAEVASTGVETRVGRCSVRGSTTNPNRHTTHEAEAS